MVINQNNKIIKEITYIFLKFGKRPAFNLDSNTSESWYEGSHFALSTFTQCAFHGISKI